MSKHQCRMKPESQTPNSEPDAPSRFVIPSTFDFGRSTFLRQRPISIAMRRAGNVEENLTGIFVTKTLAGTLVERFYGLHELLV